MKKENYYLKTILLMGVILFLSSCSTTPIKLNAINPENIPENELVTLIIHEFIKVYTINDEKIEWKESLFVRPKEILLTPGVTVFEVRFDAGSRFVNYNSYISGQLEKGVKYLLTYYYFDNNKIQYQILIYNNNEMGENIATYLPNSTNTFPSFKMQR